MELETFQYVMTYYSFSECCEDHWLL